MNTNDAAKLLNHLKRLERQRRSAKTILKVIQNLADERRQTDFARLATEGLRALNAK